MNHNSRLNILDASMLSSFSADESPTATEPILVNEERVMAEISGSVLEKPEMLQLPQISKYLIDVYKVGSLPLAILFVATVGFFAALMTSGLISMTDLVLNLVAFLIGGSILTMFFLTGIAYLEKKGDLKANEETYHLQLNIYKDLYESEKQMQDQFLLSLMEYATQVTSRPDATTDERTLEIRNLTTAVGNLTKEMLQIRTNFQPRFPEKPDTRQVNVPGNHPPN